MIRQTSKIRQVNTQLTASLRILKRTEALLVKQLSRTVHPIMSMGDVKGLVSLVESREKAVRALCDKLGPNVTSDDDAAIVAVLGSPEGEQLARESIRLEKAITAHIAKWDEGRSLSRQQIEQYEPTALTLRDRTMAFTYSALCRQVESHNDLLHAAQYAHFLQFWVWDDVYQYAGQPSHETGKTEGEGQ